MAKKKAGCCGPDAATSCCKVEAVISIDERGQMILPKDVREKAGLRAGDKLTLVSMEREGKVCCISLIKSDDFADMVKGFLEPMMSELT